MSKFVFMCFAASAFITASTGEILAAGAESVSSPNFAPDSTVGWIAVPGGFKPPPNGPGPITNDPAHPLVINLLPNYPPSGRIQGGQQTFPVADINNPILQPWAREELRKRNERILSGGTGFGRQASCWPMGTPGFLLQGVQPVYFIQTQKEIVMVWQEDYQTRRIYMNVPHSANVTPSWFGESVGHYEHGDTLVVDTIGLSTQRSYIDNFRTPHSEQEHVVERFTIAPDGESMSAIARVEDPGAFNAPITMKEYWFKARQPMIETICAENNEDFFHQGLYPVPQATMADF
jgi:hypothetical protein